jgi:predicted nucleic acid-binding protein
LIAILDSGPLYASVVANDRNHQRSVELLRRQDLELIVPAMVVAEVSYLLSTRLGPSAEAAFLRGLTAVEVEGPHPEDWLAISALVERYSDSPLGGTDASVAVLAERLGTDLIITLDRRHFSFLRMTDGRPFRLLPD